MKLEYLFTREQLIEMLEAPYQRQKHVVGRALVAIFNRQTDSEKMYCETKFMNNMGFTGTDAKRGSLDAEFYIANKHLARWQVDIWMKKNKHGIPRIAKYWKQLNEVAMSKTK